MAVTQPTGLVTFVFTDIEGSTRLLERLGAERYAEALELHRRLLRDAFAAHNGYEVGTEGDAIFAAFAIPTEALAAAGAAQQALASAVWPAGGDVRVRMGVHTGEALAAGSNYVGMDVHRAARIAAAGHGGQVLVSASTAALVDDAQLRSLGDHRFKDLQEPERVYQLGEDRFPPIRSLHRTNLPVPATPFVGRERELTELTALFSREDARVVTVTGPGGTGKTRLAVQAAGNAGDEFPDGVYWVALAPLRDRSALESTVAQALGVDEQPNLTPLNSVVAVFEGRRALLVIDNCEHLIDAVAALVRTLVERCPRLAVACSSRERLGLRAEVLFPVPPMAPADGRLLFAERARAVAPDFRADEHVAAICEAVDELPLAIELAAARVRAASTQSIRERLVERLPLLTSRDRDVDERQRTLEATIAWSYDLLDPDEQRALRALSVFAGGCTTEAAEMVAAADPSLLESLFDKSLLRHRVDGAGQDRYWMLETIREYAGMRLIESRERDRVRRMQRDYLVAQAGRFVDYRYGSSSIDSRLFKADRANYRDVLREAVVTGDAATALSLVASLGYIWRGTGQVLDAYALISQALALEGGDPRDRGGALERAASIAIDLREYDQAQRFIDEAERLAAIHDNPRILYDARNARAFLSARLGDYAAATHWARLAAQTVRTLGSHELEVRARRMELQMTRIQAMDRDIPDRPTLQRCLRMAEELLADGHRAIVQYELAAICFGLERYADALQYERSFLESHDDDSREAMFSVLFLGFTIGRLGDHTTAMKLVNAARERWEYEGYKPDSEDARYLARVESDARAALGDRAYADAVSVGRAMDFSDAVELALSVSSA